MVVTPLYTITCITLWDFFLLCFAEGILSGGIEGSLSSESDESDEEYDSSNSRWYIFLVFKEVGNLLLCELQWLLKLLLYRFLGEPELHNWAVYVCSWCRCNTKWLPACVLSPRKFSQFANYSCQMVDFTINIDSLGSLEWQFTTRSELLIKKMLRLSNSHPLKSSDIAVFNKIVF